MAVGRCVSAASHGPQGTVVLCYAASASDGAVRQAATTLCPVAAIRGDMKVPLTRVRGRSAG